MEPIGQESPVRFIFRSLVMASATLLFPAALAQAADPLPSWNEGAAKKTLVDFVAKVTQEGGKDFVRPDDRIAVLDNDGTLWCEQPLYFQGLFILDRIRVLAPQHPEWKDQEPFKSALVGDLKALAGA